VTNNLSKDAKEVASALGRRRPDSAGAPVGAARLDADKAYAGITELLQQVINDSSREAWEAIKAKIDYIYEGLDYVLPPVQEETGFDGPLKERLQKGQKLFFKPNIVMPLGIDFQTHGAGYGSGICTEWPLIAALMRWFHDRQGVRYHQMALGEGSSAVTAVAGMFSIMNPAGRKVTPEAVIEGRCGDFYGGWGFYFVRKYLAECPGPDPDDDPMQGFEASCAGTYVPPGEAQGLRVYDLNLIDDEPRKGRRIDVPGGVNFKSITLHKAVIGGDPADVADRKAYPGSVLINVPKLKVHNVTLFTNAIKNLGVGLYPMQYSEKGDGAWSYGNPHHRIPGLKDGIPHDVWYPEIDRETGLPRLDADGRPVVTKTGGLTGTMVDLVAAVQHQEVMIVSVVDAIEADNIDHTNSAPGMGVKTPEGMIFAGLDPVATDLMCARYMFSNVPLKEALGVPIEDGVGGRFPQAVPLPKLENGSIATAKGYDCPIARDNLFGQAVARKLGQTAYHVRGWDAVAGGPLISLDGHLGRVEGGAFVDVVTKNLYYDAVMFAYDLQKTFFAYLDACDALSGSSLKAEFLAGLDENGDGVVDYHESGKKGAVTIVMQNMGMAISILATDPLAALKGADLQLVNFKIGDPRTNARGFDFIKEMLIGTTSMTAYRMSQMEMESPDPFVPGLTWGKGKWPSYPLARWIFTGMALFGQGFPYQASYPSFYGSAAFYADFMQTGGAHSLGAGKPMNGESLMQYVAAVQKGQEPPLDFTFYVPAGFDNLGGAPMPNCVVTDDPKKILTVQFAGGQEIWGAV
jgi:hypothetical protein